MTGSKSQRADEPDEAWRRRLGLDLVEHMRTVRDKHPSGQKGYFVGGRCDLTTVTATRVAQETVKRYPDVVSLPVDPYRTEFEEGVEAVAA